MKFLAVSKPGNHMKAYKPPHFGRQNNYNGNYRKAICHHCQEPGHIRPNCPKLNEAPKNKVASVEEATQKKEEPIKGKESFSLAQLSEALQILLKSPSTSGAAIASSSPPGMSSWILDSGASFHMTPLENELSDLCNNYKNSYVSTADGTSLQVKSFGTLNFSKDFFVPNVRVVPQLNLNLPLCFSNM